MAKAKKQESTESKAPVVASEGSKKSKTAAAPKAPAAIAAVKEAPAAGAPASKASPAKTAKAASGAKASKAAAPVPMIETSFAAEVAAKMIAQRASGDRPASAESAAAAAPRPESSTFRNLKQGLAKPGMSGLSGILNAPQGQKKSGQPFSGGNQVGRGQTFNGASKVNVPRRTNG